MIVPRSIRDKGKNVFITKVLMKIKISLLPVKMVSQERGSFSVHCDSSIFGKVLPVFLEALCHVYLAKLFSLNFPSIYFDAK